MTDTRQDPAINSKQDKANALSPRGWHNRGYLPHSDFSESLQFITYRLADSLPLEVVRRLSTEIDTPEGNAAYRKRIETNLDTGYGECLLRQPEVARIIKDAWEHFDGTRYQLHAWVIMPNHVHVLIAMGQTSLTTIVHGWKSYTAHKINKALGRSGKVWQVDYWDRYIRDETHYVAAIEYIRNNPAKAGHISQPKDWPWTFVCEPIDEISDEIRASGDARAPGKA